MDFIYLPVDGFYPSTTKVLSKDLNMEPQLFSRKYFWYFCTAYNYGYFLQIFFCILQSVRFSMTVRTDIFLYTEKLSYAQIITVLLPLLFLAPRIIVVIFPQIIGTNIWWISDAANKFYNNLKPGSTWSTWVYLGPLGSTWVHLGPPGSTWVNLGAPGPTWVHLDPPGST